MTLSRQLARQAPAHIPDINIGIASQHQLMAFFRGLGRKFSHGCKLVDAEARAALYPPSASDTGCQAMTWAKR